MAKNATFDITSSVDLQEVDNAVNQARKEVDQRYDFKGVTAEIEFNKDAGTLTLVSEDEYKLTALIDILQSKLIKRGVPIRNLDYGKIELASLGRARQVVTLQQGISTEKGKEIVKAIKNGGFKKVQAQIQDDQVRVQSPSVDELQAVIAMLKKEDFGLELSYGNFGREKSPVVSRRSTSRRPRTDYPSYTTHDGSGLKTDD
ncbi:MAG: YajQ family cyclic di-GMP-binding protein [Gemmatimonadetes bacterium]|nr:YajQ family cyclic di-GMP-binding protein [Gemmatimonadota bacterium]